jgi:lipopolysaccharide transport system permease protein
LLTGAICHVKNDGNLATRMIIYPQKASFVESIKNIIRYKDLLVLMSKKWIKNKYEHSYIGLGWIIVSPLITTIVYTVFFGMAFDVGISRKMYFLFIYSGMLPWLFFRDVFLEVLDIFPKEPQLIKRTSFPRIIVPFSLVLLKLVEFLFGLVFLFIVALLVGRAPGISVLVLPILMLQIVLFSVGMGLLFTIPCIVYRDIRHLLKFVVPLGLYSLPIVYKIGVVPDKWIRLYTLNPMVSVIQASRSILFHEQTPWYLLAKGMSISLFVFFLGYAVFARYEKRIADYI